MIRIADGTGHCLDCADLGHLVFLGRGDATLTRRARKYSSLSAVVVQWARARRRYERQGLLVEEAALERAEAECLSDADRREIQRLRSAEARARADERLVKDFTDAIRHRFVGCPERVASTIAEHTCRRHSGRVGRTAAAKQLEDGPIDLAVRAYIRHEHTPYDEYMMAGWDRADARSAVREQVDEVMAAWQTADHLVPHAEDYRRAPRD